MDIAVNVLADMEIPCGVIVNRSGIGDREIYRYCERRDIPLLLEIPFSRKIAELYSWGLLFSQKMPEWNDRFVSLVDRIEELIG